MSRAGAFFLQNLQDFTTALTCKLQASIMAPPLCSLHSAPNSRKVDGKQNSCEMRYGVKIPKSATDVEITEHCSVRCQGLNIWLEVQLISLLSVWLCQSFPGSKNTQKLICNTCCILSFLSSCCWEKKKILTRPQNGSVNNILQVPSVLTHELVSSGIEVTLSQCHNVSLVTSPQIGWMVLSTNNKHKLGGQF